ncbi:MAG: SDR family oxidoreductase, partial [Pseudomonadota bacterium]
MGAATAAALKSAGAKIVLIDLSDSVSAKAEELGGIGYQCDVPDEAAVRAVLDKIEAEQGTPRIVVNCAGICPGARVLGREEPHPLDLFEKTVKINLIGSFNILRLTAERMSKADELNADGERGVVINTASVAAFEGQIGQAAYAASKGGVVGMTLPIAREFAKFGIRVVSIAPGIMETPMISAMPEHVQDSLKETMLFPRRLGKADEFARLALHICENAMINGETIRLDGALRLAPK